MTKREMQIRLNIAAGQMRRVLEGGGPLGDFGRPDFLKLIHGVEDCEEVCDARAREEEKAAAKPSEPAS